MPSLIFFFFFDRKLTDKPKDEKIEVIQELPEKIEELGKGNNIHLAAFQIDTNKTIKSEQSIESVAATEAQGTENKVESTESHMVMHKGALIDIEKLLQQMSRSEKAREETEIRLVELTKTNAELQASGLKAKDKIKDLQSELKSCNRKLSDAESSLSSTSVSKKKKVLFNFIRLIECLFSNIFFFQKKCSDYHSTLTNMHVQISSVLNKTDRLKKEPST